MIKFFRSIRQGLLSGNKFGKYLIYALGEILLVVIGILLALSINNWNQYRQNRSQERVLLISLKQELQQNFEQLKEKDENIKASIFRDSILLSALSNTQSKISNDELDTIAYELSVPTTYDPSLGVINTIINSGKLDIIQNPEIKFQLSSMEGKLLDYKGIEKNISDFLTISVNPYLYQNYSLRDAYNFPGEVSNSDLRRADIIQDKTFENLIVKHWEIHKATRIKLSVISESIEQMITNIDNELHK